MKNNEIMKSMQILGYTQRLQERAEKIENADISQRPIPNVNKLATQLHPRLQNLVIHSIINNSDTMRTFCLKAENGGPVAFFRAGQYLPFYIDIAGSTLTRPYSISSSPKDALNGIYEITVQKKTGGYVSNYIFENWKIGDKICSGGPEGNFYFTRLRDSKNIVGVAGGSGITPFRSMALAIVEGTMDANLTLLYGSNTFKDILYYKEFKTLEEQSNGKFKLINVLAGEEVKGIEKGFITADIIKKYAVIGDCSIFICGPQGLYRHMYMETKKLDLRKKFIRYELFGELTSPSEIEGYPLLEKNEFQITVHQNSVTKTIPARSDESITVAFERAGIDAPSKCRSGECGYCRAFMAKGEVFIPDDTDGRRGRDKELGYIHPCCSYPLSDLEVIVPRR